MQANLRNERPNNIFVNSKFIYAPIFIYNTSTPMSSYNIIRNFRSMLSSFHELILYLR